MKGWIRCAAAGVVCAGLLGACASGDSEEARPLTVLFDEGHGQHFVAGGKAPLDLSRLAATFEDEGYRVATSAQEIGDTILSGTDVLVVSGPFKPFTANENEAIMQFVARGGRLSVMLHIPQPVAPLLEQLGVVTSNGVIRERENVVAVDPMNFHVVKLAQHDLMANLDSFDMYGVWALLATGRKTTVVAQTGPTAWVDLNQDNELQPRDAVQSFAVVITGQLGSGRYVVFGDDAVFQNEFLAANNEALGVNLARWLK